MPPAGLSISVVTYATDLDLLRSTLAALRNALENAWRDGRLSRVILYLVDNGPAAHTDPVLIQLLDDWGSTQPAWRHELIAGQGNVGYGGGHNLAIRRTDCDYHLVLNPDVDMAEDALTVALTWLENNPDVCLLSPLAVDASGNRQYLCKRYPTMLDLLLRGFAPAWLKRLFHHRLANYEMRELDNVDSAYDVPIVSGCFMLFRSGPLRKLGGFAEAFFLYFEDFDLSLRASRMCRVVYVPTVHIVHHGGQAARKGWQNIRYFLVSMIHFYQRHGWKPF